MCVLFETLFGVARGTLAFSVPSSPGVRSCRPWTWLGLRAWIRLGTARPRDPDPSRSMERLGFPCFQFGGFRKSASWSFTLGKFVFDKSGKAGYATTKYTNFALGSALRVVAPPPWGSSVLVACGPQSENASFGRLRARLGFYSFHVRVWLFLRRLKGIPNVKR